jgi:hypothetical protein
MRTSLLLRASLAWLVLLAAMMGNGTLRVLVLQPAMGEAQARQAACLTGIALVLTVATLLRGWLGATGGSAQLAVGVCWLLLTVAFEFLFGHYVGGVSWEALWADYDLLRGRLWPLVLLVVLAAPWLTSLLRPLSPRVAAPRP